MAQDKICPEETGFSCKMAVLCLSETFSCGIHYGCSGVIGVPSVLLRTNQASWEFVFLVADSVLRLGVRMNNGGITADLAVRSPQADAGGHVLVGKSLLFQQVLSVVDAVARNDCA